MDNRESLKVMDKRIKTQLANSFLTVAEFAEGLRRAGRALTPKAIDTSTRPCYNRGRDEPTVTKGDDND